MRRLLLTCLFSFASIVPAFAGNACYTPEEMQAEQLLRLHSELMVIMVTCHTGSQGEDLITAYTGFTRANIGVLHAAEKTMMDYYSMNYSGDATARLDSLRTKLGNEYGQKSADISAPVFCSRYRDKVVTFYGATAGRIADEIRRMSQTETPYAAACPTSDTYVAKQGK
jgi:hypothetical protein